MRAIPTTVAETTTSPIPDARWRVGILRRGYSATGGVESYLKGLARGLLSEGHRPILLGTGEWPVDQWPGGEILRLPGKKPGIYAAGVRRLLESGQPRFDLTLSVEKVPGCDLYRTDEGVHAAWLEARAPHLTPWARFFQRVSPKHREKLRWEKRLFDPEATRRVISLSERITLDLQKHYGFPTARITLIRNGVDVKPVPDPSARSEARSFLGVADEERIVLFVGTGWERKGLRFAIRAVEALRDPRVRLLVAGKGPRQRYSSPMVRFLGPIKDMAPVYAAADVLVVPSIYEPFSLAALEALGAGVPVVTSRVAGVSEVMIPGTHGEVLDSPSDVPSWSVAISRWLDISADPARCAGIRDACRALALSCTLDRNLRETLSVMRQLVKDGGG
jgi:UDP-glucose:(heptosyl)LPS alpha-1,3-glucosyltransferase